MRLSAPEYDVFDFAVVKLRDFGQYRVNTVGGKIIWARNIE